jgi:hypothetical protein
MAGVEQASARCRASIRWRSWRRRSAEGRALRRQPVLDFEVSSEAAMDSEKEGGRR